MLKSNSSGLKLEEDDVDDDNDCSPFDHSALDDAALPSLPLGDSERETLLAAAFNETSGTF